MKRDFYPLMLGSLISPLMTGFSFVHRLAQAYLLDASFQGENCLKTIITWTLVLTMGDGEAHADEIGKTDTMYESSDQSGEDSEEEASDEQTAA